jgi:hypothetical protein
LQGCPPAGPIVAQVFGRRKKRAGDRGVIAATRPSLQRRSHKLPSLPLDPTARPSIFPAAQWLHRRRHCSALLSRLLSLLPPSCLPRTSSLNPPSRLRKALAAGAIALHCFPHLLRLAHRVHPAPHRPPSAFPAAQSSHHHHTAPPSFPRLTHRACPAHRCPAFLAPPCSPAPPIASSLRRTRFSLPVQCPASLPLRPLCALPCLLHSAASPPARGRLRPGRCVAGPLRFPALPRSALRTRRWPQGRSGSTLLPGASDGGRCTPSKTKPGRDCGAAPFGRDGPGVIGEAPVQGGGGLRSAQISRAGPGKQREATRQALDRRVKFGWAERGGEAEQ